MIILKECVAYLSVSDLFPLVLPQNDLQSGNIQKRYLALLSGKIGNHVPNEGAIVYSIPDGIYLQTREYRKLDKLVNRWKSNNTNCGINSLSRNERKIWELDCNELVRRFSYGSEHIVKSLNDGSVEDLATDLLNGSSKSSCKKESGASLSVTKYKLLSCDSQHSWVEMEPLTGRKHQLRIQALIAFGIPIKGDVRYGWRPATGGIPKHICLYAHSIDLPHPLVLESRHIQ